MANIPLEMEGDKPGAYDMVFGSSACLVREPFYIKGIKIKPFRKVHKFLSHYLILVDR
jgi:hypothetical protein